MHQTFEYTPKTTADGKKQIINEKCGCGHLRTQHQHRFDLGHGKCTACPCPQFSWVGWIFATKRKRKSA